MKKREIIALDDLRVDLEARRVSRDGEELELGRLSFDLLAALIRAAPAALSNDEIVERVWSGDAVTDENVKQRISLLRRALDQGTGRDYIETLRGFGYRLAEEPYPSPTGTDSPLPPRPTRGDRLARRLLLFLAITSFILLITLLAIAARQLKRVRLGDLDRTTIGRPLEAATAVGPETARGEVRCGLRPAVGGPATRL